jgi:hypothetical protein
MISLFSKGAEKITFAQFQVSSLLDILLTFDILLYVLVWFS